ncbi:ABC transporter ATP-binding protein [Methanoregula formicica]|uniref:ABC-type multidrug transport system, ATPase component n=1 Tax=Methanoregula formicica (strain DSM 22288 / NBRC 105244 / SMSP) TaxID=593750 RepID=L0H9L9_METFS|nr:ABC transporter ATP-binding protein [Methanoregula formicica]AGB01442.1 ABC-type multidrug transport system, ATPase component [Methanoregula formicica SMSP]
MITAHNLTKDFDGFLALDNISFSFEDGEIFGIIGHNGAGKTTLLKIISGLITPTSGELFVNDIDVVKDPLSLKQNLGYLPEESRLYETMTAENYLAFFGEIYGLSQQEIKVRSSQLFAALSLEPDGKKIGEFSKGMKRKAAIARSLIHNPGFLVYDEATSGLDPMTSRFIADYLRRLRQDKKTIVLSAHNLYQVEAICDKVMILRRGKVVAFGTMKELRDQFGSLTYTIFFSIDDPAKLVGHSRTYRQEEGFFVCEAEDMKDLNECTATITEAGGRVEKIESRYPSLEEMLLKIGK